jgi:hypothetical protein
MVYFELGLDMLIEAKGAREMERVMSFNGVLVLSVPVHGEDKTRCASEIKEIERRP